MLDQWILKLTHRLWNRQISRILCRAREENIIDYEQLHVMLAAFDPTQKHIVYGDRVQHGFNGPRGVLSRDQVIPSGVYWSPSGSNFYSYNTRRGMGNEFFATWNSRKHEFPQWDGSGQK